MIRKLLMATVIILVSFTGFSQTGTLMGKVTDAETKQPIPFANVIIELGGKMINGATTDFDGKYTIKPIPPGKYDVKATYVGYKKYLIQSVIIVRICQS